jgi:hypothetical protein
MQLWMWVKAMSSRPFRRANFITPFGPGAISVAPDGTAAITAGLDHWYETPPSRNKANYDISEFKFHEWRLERDLSLDHLRLPPDYRTPTKGQRAAGDAEVNLLMQVPLLRFPRWHVCTNLKCQTLREFPMSAKEQPTCDHCQNDFKRPRPMIQVQFIAMCEEGHIQDFPWREWVHSSVNPSCNGRLRFFGMGSATLGGRYVKCECGKQRDLSGILNNSMVPRKEGEPLTFLSAKLSADGTPYRCTGLRPWLGEKAGQGCGSPLFGTLRGATNVYFPIVRSSIYLPLQDQGTPAELTSILEEEKVRTNLATIKRLTPDVTPELLREELKISFPGIFDKFPDEDVDRGIREIELGETANVGIEFEGDEPETSFRRAEYEVLSTGLNHEELVVKPVDIARYEAPISKYFSKVQLIKTLRETRVFTGFSRLNSQESLSREDRVSQLWRHPDTQATNWLPAYKVYGEGLFVEVREDLLRSWEQSPSVVSRIRRLDQRYQRLVQERGYAELTVSPRFILLHTLSHLLINQLVFDCGYSSAALRERLYVSDNPDAPMAGILIYTASGDSDGTMGGLVRMGEPGYLEPVIVSAVRNASWCSSDPVCMELGASGQGPDSCNLAACHSCSLLPETSCERFNRFLDRWTVVGSHEAEESGFFSSLAKLPI